MQRFSIIELAILQMLETIPLHGYAMTSKIETFSGGKLRLPAGSLYPSLHKLERNGLIWSQQETYQNRSRRVYALTGVGYTMLEQQKATWQVIARTMNALLSIAA